MMKAINKYNLNNKLNNKTTKLFLTLSCLFAMIIVGGQFANVYGIQVKDGDEDKKEDTTSNDPSIKKPAIIFTRLPKPKTEQVSKKDKKTKKSKKTILVRFYTPEPKQEVWKGKKRLGTSSSNRVLNVRLTTGNHMIQVKDKEGKVVAKPTLINVSRASKLFRITADPPVVEKPTVEDVKKDDKEEKDNKEAVEKDATEKINDIMTRYADPVKSSTITTADWEYIYQMALDNKMKNFTAIQIEAQRWFSSGQIDLAKGNYDNAYGAFTKSVEYMPGSAYPYYALGEAYTANKKFAEAFGAYQKAITTDPKFALAHSKIGDIHLSANRSRDAITSYQAALKNGLNTPDLHFNLAKAYKRNKQWGESAKELEYVVKEDPKGEVFIELGDLYVQSKRNISAFEAYQKATEMSPESAIAFVKLAQILNEEREYERSKMAAEKALELDKDGKEINLSIVRRLVREATQKLK